MVAVLEELKFRFYQPDQLRIDSIDSRLDNQEKKCEDILWNTIIDEHVPFSMDSNKVKAAKAMGCSIDRIDALYENLLDKNVIAVELGYINFIYPVSGLATNHNIRLEDGREFSAMCAIDGIGTNFTFKQDIVLNSICSSCGEKIFIDIRDGKIFDYYPKDMHILHVDLNKNRNWSGDC